MSEVQTKRSVERLDACIRKQDLERGRPLARGEIADSLRKLVKLMRNRANQREYYSTMYLPE